MVTRAEFVAEAATWKGTPFHWQASCKGAGADCKGYPKGVAEALGLPEAAGLYALMDDYGHDGVVPVQTLLRGLAATFERVTDAPRLADLLLLVVHRRPQHLGIHGGEVLWHTYTGKAVMASPLAGCLRVWPLHSAWRFRSLED